MLTKITLENFKSFHEKTEIDFNKTNYTFLPQNVADSGVLKGAVFVGANASGKSNVLEAIKLLLDLLFSESDLHLQLYANFLNLNDPEKNFFKISYEFLIRNHKIEYQVQYFNKTNAFIEYLSIDGKELMWRVDEDAKSFLSDASGVAYQSDSIIKDGLFLRTLYFNTKFIENEILQEWMQFLSASIYYHQARTELKLYSAKELKTIYQYLKENGTEEFNDFLSKYRFPHQIDYYQGDSQKGGSNMIFFKRTLGANSYINMPEVYESTGNRALIRMLHLFFVALSRNCMLIVDEFSSCLHNDLEELLMRHFMEKSKQSQIFIVTHSTNLLSNAILRPDQEYAVEFRKTGSSVKRFSSEQPRLAQNVEKMYVSGVFGGLPHYHETES
ncbi:MAG: ATP-binding protein [Akkermansia sp.]